MARRWRSPLNSKANVGNSFLYEKEIRRLPPAPGVSIAEGRQRQQWDLLWAVVRTADLQQCREGEPRPGRLSGDLSNPVPDVNAALGPGEWQTVDLEYKAASFDATDL